MTVCIAAITEGLIIFGASDRMMTSGDIEFEPSKSVPGKILPVTNSIVLMTAGDASLQQQIFQSLVVLINTEIKENPNSWISVASVAEQYVKCYNEIKLKRSVAALLAPLGLDHQSFLAQQKTMLPETVQKLTREMLCFQMPQVETIIAGVDNTPFHAAHIFKVVGDYISCEDAVGFAAVGIGARHAETHFMNSQHNRSSPLAETLLRVYFAKKISEVSPGVGKETDLFTIGPQLGTFSFLKQPPDGKFEIAKLQNIYETAIKAAKKVERTTIAQMTAYVDELRAKMATPQQSPPSDSVTPPDTTK